MMNKVLKKYISLVLVWGVSVAPLWAAPVVSHDPIQTAVKGTPLAIRALVRDSSSTIDGVALFYATSRGTTPFRSNMSSAGAGAWYATIPGHLIGPGNQLFYYIQAENANGETTDTDWVDVRVVEKGLSPEAIPSATTVAQQRQQQAQPAVKQSVQTTPAPKTEKNKNKYLIPGAVIVGGAVAIGGAIALASDSGGGSGGGGDSYADGAGNFGGTFSKCFEPSNTAENPEAYTVCDNGNVNVYIDDNGDLRVVGLWGGEVLTGHINGSSFSMAQELPATGDFPAAHIIVTGSINGTLCSANVDGYSKESERPGNFTGRLSTTKR